MKHTIRTTSIIISAAMLFTSAAVSVGAAQTVPSVTDFEVDTSYDEYLSRGGFIRLSSVTFDDGKTVTNIDAGDRNGEVSAYAGGDEVNYTYTTDNDPWSRGEHRTTVTCNGIEKTVTYTVEKSVVDHISVNDVTVGESDHRYVISEEFPAETRSYFEYNPGYLICYTDGTTYDPYGDSVGGDNIIGSKMLERLFVSFSEHGDVQTHENRWRAGEHKLTATLVNLYNEEIHELDADFTVTVLPEAVHLMGDANMDGVLSIEDATLIQRASIGLEELSTAQRFGADTNGDGRVSVLDVTCVQKQIAGFTAGTGKTGKIA